jgi:phosphohistidine phosphatase
MRHAKAVEQVDWMGADFDRPLTSEGEESNKIMANYLRLIGVKPDMIIASPALRTKETAEIIAKKFHEKVVSYQRDIYNEDSVSSRDPIKVHLDIVKKAKKNTNILMIVGHNDDLSLFAANLCGEWVPSMKKGSIIVLSLPEDADWKDIKPGICKFIYYLTPHFLRLESLDK